MSTLFFCTAYARTPSEWTARYRRWLQAIERIARPSDTILIVDDGSQTLPGWPGLQVRSGDRMDWDPRQRPTPGIHLFHFRKHLGRPDLFDFPGWHRSYAYGATFGEAGRFTRVVHVESDAVLLTERAAQWCHQVRNAWASPWTAKYGFPEIAIQVAHGAGIARMAAFARRPYRSLRGKIHEKVLPLTHVERSLKGDRVEHDETRIPPRHDFATQVPQWREPGYYWWLDGKRPRPSKPVLAWDFGANSADEIGFVSGWSGPEPHLRWMIGDASVVSLPPLPPARDYSLTLSIMPHVRELVPFQRLFVKANDVLLGAAEVAVSATFGFALPRRVLRGDGSDVLRLVHPDGVRPSAFGAPGDDRLLSVAILTLKIHAS